MLFERQFRIGQQSVRIEITEEPFLEEDNIIVWGFPLNFPAELSFHNYQLLIPLIKGNFLIIIRDSNKVLIISDIVGGYRSYYCFNDNEIIVATDANKILKIIKQESLSINKNELFLLKNVGYTSAFSTIYDQIKKIPPSSIIYFDENGLIKQKIYIGNINTCKPDAKKHISLVQEDLSDTFDIIKKMKKKVIIFFSGGYDSLLLMEKAEDSKLDYIALYFNPVYDGLYDETELERVKFYRSKYNIKIIDLDIRHEYLTNKAFLLNNSLYDRHFGVLHIASSNYLKTNYDKNIIILNGQSSDSIFSFGPTENTVLSLIRRILLGLSYNVIMKMMLFIISFIFKDKKYPRNEEEYFIGFFFNSKYLPLVFANNDINVYLKDIICTNFINKYSGTALKYVLKIFSFLQGSDNQIVYKSLRHNGYYNIVLPYASPQIISATWQNKNVWKDILLPKYPIKKSVKQKYKKPFYLLNRRSEYDHLRKRLMAEINHNYYEYIKKISEDYL